MRLYFEKTYPRRLEELKENLDIITREFTNVENSKEKLEVVIKKFMKEVSLFAENTEMHLVNKTPDARFIEQVSPENICGYLGKTKAGRMFKFIYIENKKEDKKESNP